MAAEPPYSLEQAELDVATLIGQADRMSEVITKNDSTDPPNLPAAGIIHYSLGGQHKYASADGNYYNTGRLTLRTTGGTISATAFATIGGLSAPVAAAEYHFRAHLMYVGNGTGTTAVALFKVTSPAFTSGSLSLVGTANGPLVSVRFDNASGFGTSLSAPVLTAADSTTRYDAVIEGDAIFTASGTLAVQAAINGAGTAQFVIAAGSTLELFPVT